MPQYLALLRGINVGGKNIIKMTALKACFEAQGFSGVTTFIQSGNVVFSARDAASAKLSQRVEEMLEATFGYQASVVLCSRKQLRAIVEQAPKGFGTKPDEFRYDVIFLKAPLTAAVAMQSVRGKPGVDEVYAGRGVIYFSRLIAKASQSQLSRVIALPIYKNMTIRNWNTTTKLLALMEAEA